MNTRHYFAYGSNLLVARLRARIPIVADLGQRALGGWALNFHKRGRDGSGKCNIVPSNIPEARVHGVVFVLTASALAALDQIEGVGHGYQRITVTLESNLGVATYVAESSYIEPTLKPYRWYRDLVLAGAREHDLPESYLALLAAIEVIDDPDLVRALRHRALLSP